MFPERCNILLVQERKLAILLYGFPPGVGATGTAALLNVPKSLENALKGLQAEGYDLGLTSQEIDGEAIITALKLQEDQRAIFEGAAGIQERLACASLYCTGSQSDSLTIS